MDARKRGEKRREMVLQAVVDPKFRRELLRNPKKVFGVKELTSEDKQSLEMLKRILPAIDGMIDGISDSILCGTGGCGGLA
jgi:hypothetical protein